MRAGDVILKVNDHEISNNDDFTWLLEQAGPSSQVSFTVARPDKLAEEALNVKLSAVLNPKWSFRSVNRRGSGPDFSLIDQGIETIVLKPPVASQLGTTAGLLVVYVDLDPSLRRRSSTRRRDSIHQRPAGLTSAASIPDSNRRSFDVTVRDRAQQGKAHHHRRKSREEEVVFIPASH